MICSEYPSRNMGTVLGILYIKTLDIKDCNSWHPCARMSSRWRNWVSKRLIPIDDKGWRQDWNPFLSSWRLKPHTFHSFAYPHWITWQFLPFFGLDINLPYLVYSQEWVLFCLAPSPGSPYSHWSQHMKEDDSCCVKPHTRHWANHLFTSTIWSPNTKRKLI